MNKLMLSVWIMLLVTIFSLITLPYYVLTPYWILPFPLFGLTYILFLIVFAIDQSEEESLTSNEM